MEDKVIIKSIDDREFYRKMLVIGIPVVLQNFISIGLNLIDTLMIGMLGKQELAAVGAANQVYFIYVVTLFGLFSGAAVYTAQYWGARNLPGIKHLIGIDYLIAIALAVGVMVIAYAFAPGIIRLFSNDTAVIRYGTQYIRIASLSYPISGISMVISYNARAIQRLNIVTTISAVALGINAFLNYLLIFGKFGMPHMGVRGAATATLIARICELVAIMIYVYSTKNHPFRGNLKELFGFSKNLLANVMRMAIPVVFTEGGWALSFALIFAAYGRLGTSALAVAQVVNVVCDMLQSFYFGVGNSTAMLIGETLGQGNKDKAYRYGKLALYIVLVMNIIMTAVMILLAKPIANIYDFDAATTHLLILSICAQAITITPKMLGYLPVVGILRAGGDTLFCMKLDLTCNFCVQVPIAFIAVLLLHWTLPVAMIAGEMGDLIRIAVCMPRFKSRKWINIVV
jgi:putative efflux protein, MATE family